jgi:hypothetical protein
MLASMFWTAVGDSGIIRGPLGRTVQAWVLHHKLSVWQSARCWSLERSCKG